jgi:hypothetical protein
VLLGVSIGYLLMAQIPPQFISAKYVLAVFGIVLFAYLPMVFNSFYFEGGKLAAKDDGVALPPPLWGLGEVKAVRWADVTAVDYYFDPNGRAFLSFETGRGLVEIDVSFLAPDALDRLLVAMEGWLPDRRWSEAAVIRRDYWKIGVAYASHMPSWVLELRAHFIPQLDGGAASAENTPSP